MKTLSKWNFVKHNYEDHHIPEEWNTPLHTNNMSELVNCAECGEVLTFGETYTSRKIHSYYGFGYPVCGKCHQKEWEEERRYVQNH